MSNTDSKNGDLGSIQKVQNKMARFLNSKTLKDKIPTSELLSNIDMLSIKQLNAKIKIIEIWKALNIEKYPLRVDRQTPRNDTTSTRAMTTGRLIEMGKSNLSLNSCVGDAVRLWNKLPDALKESSSLTQIKKAAKLFSKSLPV